jgi:hypothetical protein
MATAAGRDAFSGVGRRSGGQVPSGSSGHLLTALGATPAHVGAAPHLFVRAVHRRAVLRTSHADLRTGPAGEPVHVHAERHRIGTGVADLRAGDEQADMVGRSMLAAHAQAMPDQFLAGAVALRAQIDALRKHCGVGSVHMMSPVSSELRQRAAAGGAHANGGSRGGGLVQARDGGEGDPLNISSQAAAIARTEPSQQRFSVQGKLIEEIASSGGDSPDSTPHAPRIGTEAEIVTHPIVGRAPRGVPGRSAVSDRRFRTGRSYR